MKSDNNYNTDDHNRNDHNHTNDKESKWKIITKGVVPFVLLVIVMAYIVGPGSELLDLGVPLPDLSIEKVDFIESEIQVTVRNTGPIPVEVAMADVNDRIQPSAIEPDRHLERYESALVRIPFEWNEAQPYVIGITVDDGTRFEKEIEAAAYALEPNLELAGFFAVIGTYVGIIPVMIGLLWLPFIKKMRKGKYHFFLALTAGLLLFLGIDAIREAVEVSDQDLSDRFNGKLLISTIILLSFLALYYSGNKLAERGKKNIESVTSDIKSTQYAAAASPAVVSLMIAIGIGLHNFGEGLTIGAAVGLGSIAFSTFLIIGFTLHNTTEGIAIAAPLSRGKVSITRLAMLGMIAGSPAIFGAWIGGFVYSPFTTIIFLSVGAGAIFQVIIIIMKWIRTEGDTNFSSGATATGLVLGMAIMYITGIII
jgi:zinc transporter ZupT